MDEHARGQAVAAPAAGPRTRCARPRRQRGLGSAGGHGDADSASDVGAVPQRGAGALLQGGRGWRRPRAGCRPRPGQPGRALGGAGRARRSDAGLEHLGQLGRGPEPRQGRQAAPRRLHVPPVLQQGALHQGLPPGAAEGGRPDSIPRQEEVFWRVQMP